MVPSLALRVRFASLPTYVTWIRPDCLALHGFVPWAGLVILDATRLWPAGWETCIPLPNADALSVYSLSDEAKEPHADFERLI